MRCFLLPLLAVFLLVVVLCVPSVTAARDYGLVVTAIDPPPATGSEETEVITAWDNQLEIEIGFNGSITTTAVDNTDNTWTLTSTVSEASTSAQAAMDALETPSASWDNLEQAVFDDTSTNFTLNLTAIAAAPRSGSDGDGDAVVPAVAGSIAAVVVICFAIVALIVIVVVVVLLVVVIAVIIVTAVNKGGGGKSGEDPWYNDSSDLYEDSL